MTIQLAPHGQSGALLAICGFDGSGKTTLQAGLIATVSPTQSCVGTCAPSQWWRDDPRARRTLFGLGTGKVLTEQALLLFNLADCYAHQADAIQPGLADGALVIADRYLYDMLALFEARGTKPPEWVQDAAANIVAPNLCFVLDGPADLIVDRVVRRDGAVPGKFDQDVDFVDRYNTALRRLAEENGLTLLRADADPAENQRRCLDALRETGLWQGA